jgi:signal peptidase I
VAVAGWTDLLHILNSVSHTRRIIFGRNPKRTTVRIAVLTFLSVVTFGWVLTPTRVRGISMLPTYRDSTLNLVNRMTYKVRSPARGDVVAIRLAGPSVVYVKRIIALPRERVAIVQGTVEINGTPLAEPYVRQRQPWNYAEITVGPSEYFVIGDNRSMRMADHDFGRVEARRILGKLLF